jgi:hypothetical protein
MAAGPRYITLARTAQKTPLPTAVLFRACLLRPLPHNGRVCRAIPLQLISMLTSKFWLSADMPHYLVVILKGMTLFCKMTGSSFQREKNFGVKLCDRDSGTCALKGKKRIGPPYDVTLQFIGTLVSTCNLPEVTMCGISGGDNRSQDSDETCALGTSNLALVAVSRQGSPFIPNTE